MSSHVFAGATGGARSALLSAVVVAGVAGAVVLAHPSWPSSTTAASPVVRAADSPRHLVAGSDRPVGVADGVVPAGVTVLDDRYPAVTRLDPALLEALRRAAGDAARDGVELYVNSGWRSAKYQDQLLEEAVAEYGSRAAAARWVATATTSAHVAGKAVDLGHSDADAWLARYGAAYGLCRIYANEPWHYELRPYAVHDGCPRPYADASHDPRMQR